MDRVSLSSLSKINSRILRGMAILLVLLGHAGYFAWGGAAGVVIFLFISGYGIDRSCLDRGLDGVWKRRIRKVWLPYFVISLCLLRIDGITELRRIVFTLLSLDVGQLADPTMWYISYILLWYLLYFTAEKLSSLIHYPFASYVKAALLFAFGIPVKILSEHGFWNMDSCSWFYYLTFPLGVFMSVLSDIQVPKKGRVSVWLGLLILTATSAVRHYGFTDYSYTTVLMALGLQFVALVQVWNIEGVLQKALLWLGDYSFSIYLLEGIVLRRREAWFGVFENHHIMNLLFIVISILLAVIFQDGLMKTIDFLISGTDNTRVKTN